MLLAREVEKRNTNAPETADGSLRDLDGRKLHFDAAAIARAYEALFLEEAGLPALARIAA